MKKSKVVLAIVLAVVLLITVWNVPTFSWFSRPHNQAGEKMVLESNNSYTAYNGYNVTISTFSSATGAENSYTTEVTNSSGFSGNNIGSYGRDYYMTTITNNNSGAAQNVSLYAKTLRIPTANNGTLALGVNGPTRSYRDYSSLAEPTTKTTRDMMRIYFEKDNSVTGWNGTEFYICWNEDTNTDIESLNGLGSNGTYTKLTHVGGTGYPNQYFADIPKTATHAFFAVENFGTNDNGNPNWGQRSQTLWNLAGDGQTQLQSKLYKITSNTNDSGNHLVDTWDVTGNCINSYYSNIFVAAGNTYNASLSSSEFIGGSLEYYSGDTSVFTVNQTTGEISAVSAGTAKLYTKSAGGSYPDSQQVETNVTVTGSSNYDFYDVPIVRNILIPANTSVNVYWYVLNNSESKPLRYTIDSLYVGM